MIVSGTGGWRYVDCVSSRAGKLQALERVRALFSVPRDRCVAAGDSGNDILMLEGKPWPLCLHIPLCAVHQEKQLCAYLAGLSALQGQDRDSHQRHAATSLL